MVLQQILDVSSLVPGPSSQTTCAWPLLLKEGNAEIKGEQVGHDISSLTIRAFGRDETNDLIEEIFAEYDEAWKRLATL